MKITKATTSKLKDLQLDNLTFGSKFTDHMLLCHYKNGAWQEPEIMPFGPISFTPALHTLHYGQAIFEGQKAYYMDNGKIGIFRLRENGLRLNKSAHRMFMPEFPVDLFVESTKELVNIDRDWVPNRDGYSLYLRPFMFGSSEFVAARPSEDYTYCLIMSPVGPYYSGDVKVKVEEHYTRATSGGVGAAKCAGNYGGSFIAADEARKQGFNQVIWTDHKNHELVEESGTMNIAFVIDDTFITPPLSDRILAGITRDSILTMLREANYLKVEERPISIHEVANAAREGRLQEAFGMGTAAVVSRISGIGYRDESFEVPTPEDGYALRIKRDLNALRMGRIEDKYNWMTIL